MRRTRPVRFSSFTRFFLQTADLCPDSEAATDVEILQKKRRKLVSDMRETQYFVLFFTGLCCLRPCRPLQYHFIDSALPWSEARSYCRAAFTDLATVGDAESMKLLVEAAQKSSGGFKGRVWIGLHDNLTNWRWSLADPAHYAEHGRSYRNWDSGQPDNFFGDQMCAKTILGGVWEDSSCVRSNPFVCFDDAAVFDKRFVFVAQQLSWSDAQQYCRGRYTDLASVRNRDENTQIRRLSSRGAWIGLHRTRDWSDGSDSTFRFWTSGQPDNAVGKQRCVAAHLGNAGRWSDEECGRSLAFVCYGERVTTTEKPSTTRPPTETTSPERPSTTHVTQFETTEPDQTTSTPDGTSESPSTTQTDQTTATTDGRMTTHSSSAATTVDGDSTTAELDQTTGSVPGAEHVIHLGVKLQSKVELSDDDVKQLLLVELHKRLLEMGLPSSLRLVLKKP